MRALPGVQHAAVASGPPLLTGWQSGFLPEGMEEPAPGLLPSIDMNVIGGDYFEAIGTPLLRGRAFTPQDTKDAPLVIIIDQATAQRFFPGQDAVGKRVRMQTDNDGYKWREIVGVVPQLKLYGYNGETALAQGYIPQTEHPNTGLTILLRTSAPIGSLERPLRQIVASLDPAQPVFDLKTMQERVAETWSTPRLMAFLLGAFALLALSLAVVGIYGVMAYNGQRRIREIGVRLALGARRRQIVSMMLRQGGRLLGIGLLVGLAGAFGLSRVIRSLLFEVNAGDPATYLTVGLLLATTAAVACWIPARRASRVDPMITLRAE
ncbi:MAG: ABC transporter permease [Chthoniobacterales bacterium]|nr:ABC transporter permease [Chthoniobacterales bacterium]